MFCFLVMFSVCSWNVRGLSNSRKCRALKCVVTSLRKAVVCLQETKLSLCLLSFLNTFCSSFYDKMQDRSCRSVRRPLDLLELSHFFV